jgi:hypothetical protein
MAAALGTAGAGFYTTTFARPGGFSFTGLLMACLVGALSALLGSGVGTLIERARNEPPA